MTFAARTESTVMRPGDVAIEPWRNGKGVTRVMAMHPAWRISLAEIDGPATFSTFPGFDRVLIPLDGRGLDLELNGVVRRVEPRVGIAFRGEDRVSADPDEGPVTVVNFMVCRSLVGAGWTVSIETGAAFTGTETNAENEADAAVALTGTAIAPDARLLSPGSVIVQPGQARIEPAPDEMWAVLRLRPAPPSAPRHPT